MILRDVIPRMRERPGMYLGEASVSAFHQFLNGYYAAIANHRIDEEHILPKHFHDWVAYRTQHKESTPGWKNMIIARFGDCPKGFSRVFELVEEYHAREEIVVAVCNDYEAVSRSERNGIVEEIPYPKQIKMVTYTNDPGFFVYGKNGEELFLSFFPQLSLVKSFLGLPEHRWEIVSETEFTRIKSQQFEVANSDSAPVVPPSSP